MAFGGVLRGDTMPKKETNAVGDDAAAVSAAEHEDGARVFRHDAKLVVAEKHDAKDAGSVILLIFVALVTPYEVAFLDVRTLSPLWCVNRIIDGIFFIDLLINFNLIYFSDSSHGFVTDRKKVVARGFFIVDLLSILPFKELSQMAGSGGGDNFKLIRIIRIVRLTKLLGILRGSRIFQRVENNLTISYGLVRLYKFLLMVLLLCHWLACLWNLVRRFERSRCNWAAAYFTESSCFADVNDDIDSASPFQMYLVSFYLAVMTTSTVGYGDVSPVTDAERSVLIVAMLLGASLYAYVVGNICDIVSTLNQRESEFQEKMDNVNRFIRGSGLSDELSARIRSFFRYRRNAADFSRYVRIINTLSPQMRGEVALELNSHWMQNIDLFDGCPENVLIEVSFVVKPRSFPPMEEFISTEHMVSSMYIIRRGLVASKGRVKGAGSAFGQDVILANVPYRYKATTLTYVDLSILDRSDLELILESFPGSRKILLKRAKRASIRERLIIFAKAVRAMERVFHLEEEAKKRGNHGGGMLPHTPPAQVGSKGEITRTMSISIPEDGQMIPGTPSDEEGDAVAGAGKAGNGAFSSVVVPTGSGVAAAGDDGAQSQIRIPWGASDATVSLDVSLLKMKRSFLDFDSEQSVTDILPFGGMINVMMFASKSYERQVEAAATKIQSILRGASTRKRLQRTMDDKMSDLRDQMADDKLSMHLTTKIMAEQGVEQSTPEQTAATPFRSPSLRGVDLSVGGSIGGSMPLVRLSTALSRNINDTNEKVDKLGVRVDAVSDDLKVVFEKVTEMYKIILRSNMHNTEVTSANTASFRSRKDDE